MTRILLSGSPGKMERYVQAVASAGGCAAARYAPEDADGYDGVLLCGGGDITPALYGMSDEGTNHGVDPVREAADLRLIADCMAAGKPLLGICRGMQMLNVFFGGTLLQDLGGKNAAHAGTPEGDRRHAVHAVGQGVLPSLYGAEFEVNSNHHQAVRVPGAGLRVTCRGADGVIEAMEHEMLPVLAVQWHPERWEGGSALLAAFIKLCK